MKKLYQVKIKAKIERPKEFSKIIEGKEIVENIVLCASETEDDAVIIILGKYIEATTSNIADYRGVVLRGEFTNLKRRRLEIKLAFIFFPSIKYSVALYIERRIYYDKRRI